MTSMCLNPLFNTGIPSHPEGSYMCISASCVCIVCWYCYMKLPYIMCQSLSVCVRGERELWYRLWLCLITNQPWALWWQNTSTETQSAGETFPYMRQYVSLVQAVLMACFATDFYSHLKLQYFN